MKKLKNDISWNCVVDTFLQLADAVLVRMR